MSLNESLLTFTAETQFDYRNASRYLGCVNAVFIVIPGIIFAILILMICALRKTGPTHALHILTFSDRANNSTNGVNIADTVCVLIFLAFGAIELSICLGFNGTSIVREKVFGALEVTETLLIVIMINSFLVCFVLLFLSNVLKPNAVVIVSTFSVVLRACLIFCLFKFISEMKLGLEFDLSTLNNAIYFPSKLTQAITT